MPINKEFGQDMSGAPDPLTPQQRCLIRQRDKARALAQAWGEVADNYQAAFAATKQDDERSSRLFIGDARSAQDAAESLPAPTHDNATACSRCGEPIPDDGPKRCARCYTD